MSHVTTGDTWHVGHVVTCRDWGWPVSSDAEEEAFKGCCRRKLDVTQPLTVLFFIKMYKELTHKLIFKRNERETFVAKIFLSCSEQPSSTLQRPDLFVWYQSPISCAVRSDDEVVVSAWRNLTRGNKSFSSHDNIVTSLNDMRDNSCQSFNP